MRGSVARLLAILFLSVSGAGLIPAANAQSVVGDPSGWDATTKKAQQDLRIQALRAGFLEHKIRKGTGLLKKPALQEYAVRGHYTHNQGFHYAPWTMTATTLEYQVVFNRTARYKHTQTVNGADYQTSMNKLPGFSDCGQTNMLYAGAMFGWRWNADKDQLELYPFTNTLCTAADKCEGRKSKNHTSRAFGQPAAGVAGPAPLAISLAELDKFRPLTYRIEIKGNTYLMSIKENGRVLADAGGAPYAWTMPRSCADKTDKVKVGSNLFFGGKLQAQHKVSAYIKGLPKTKPAAAVYAVIKQSFQQAATRVVDWAKVNLCKAPCLLKKKADERDTCARKCKEKYTK